MNFCILFKFNNLIIKLEDGVAKELIVLNIRQSSLQNNANTPNSAKRL
ncbi:hypothetical protein [Campylobacter hyointestinalis]|nr:hypothetical protein [Campylobacter hyointestinalis]